MNWLLLFVPITVALEYLAPERHLLIFVSSGLAILPLAALMGRATEQLAERMGEGVGGLLNATFGNAAELIIALAALREGLYDVVKASIAGSIVGNILLVLGAAMTMGGLRHREQTFNPQGARAQATMMTLAAIALVLPAAYQDAVGKEAVQWIGAAQRLDLDRAARRLRALSRLQPGDAFRAVLGFARAEGRAVCPLARRSGGGGAGGQHGRDRLDERNSRRLEFSRRRSRWGWAACSSVFSSSPSWATRPSTRRRSRWP